MGGDTPVNGYEIQYSTNGVDFETVKKVTGDSVKDACRKQELCRYSGYDRSNRRSKIH